MANDNAEKKAAKKVEKVFISREEGLNRECSGGSGLGLSKASGKKKAVGKAAVPEDT
jgi:hypothetical protein